MADAAAASGRACQRFTLDNGLRVLLVTDHRAPLVAVHMAYRAGAADEPQGRHGLAHLFEHLMYGGSAQLPGAYLTQLHRVGAHDLNGHTGLDSTHYFETVHRKALAFALYAEADRMARPALSEATLQRQRQVVGEELRQHREQAQAVIDAWIAQGCYAPDHPYHHGIAGSAGDLARITLADVRDWQRRYYQPANAVLALAGDLDIGQARQLCARYFGALPTTPIAPRSVAPARPAAPRRRLHRLRLAAPRLYRVWNIAAAEATAQHDAWLLLRELIEARLHTRADAALAAALPRYRCGRLGAQLELELRCVPTDALPAAQRWLAREWQALLGGGFSPGEIERGRRVLYARQLQRLDSRKGLAELCIESELRHGAGGYGFAQAARLAALDGASLQALLRAHLGRSPFELEVQPLQKRATVPPVVHARAASAPHQEARPVVRAWHAQTDLEWILAPRARTERVAGRLLLPAGSAHEPGDGMGLAELSARLLCADDARGRTAFSEAAAALGLVIQLQAQADCTRLAWTVPRPHWRAALQLIAARLQQPHVDREAFARQRAAQQAGIAAQCADARWATQRVLPVLLWGAEQPLARTSLGLRSQLARLDLPALQAFRSAQYRPGGTRCLLAGDLDAAEVETALGDTLASWSGAALAMPQAAQGSAAARDARDARCHLIELPGSEQTLLTVAWRLPRADATQEPALQALDLLLAGSFSSRLNLRLREDLGWTYGVRSRLTELADARHYEIQVWLPAQRVVAARGEILRAVRSFAQDGVSPAGLRQLQRGQRLREAGSVERIDDLCMRLERHLRLGFADAEWQRSGERFAALRCAPLRAAAEHLSASPALSVMAGDARRLRPLLARAGIEAASIAADAEALY